MKRFILIKASIILLERLEQMDILFLYIQSREGNRMATIKLELDFLIGPIIKDVFNAEKNELVTGVAIVDNDEIIDELNSKIMSLYSSFYNFDKDSCSFDVDVAKEHKLELVELIKQLTERLNFINDGSFEIDNRIHLDF